MHNGKISKAEAIEAMRTLFRFAGFDADGQDPERSVERLAVDPEERAWLFELSCPRPDVTRSSWTGGVSLDAYGGLKTYDDDDEEETEGLW